jgi:Flp pilus assembly protein TadG
MKQRDTRLSWLHRRLEERAQIMVLSAVLLPVMLGFVGMALDVGLLLVHRTDRQNSADAAAVAGAQYLMYNPTDTSGAIATACAYAQKNGYGAGSCPSAEVRVNIPPKSGPNTANAGAVEVVITKTDSTYFVRMLGLNNVTVQGRAVGSSKPRKANYALVILDPTTCDAFTTSTDITITGGGAIVDSNATTGGSCIGEGAAQNGGSVITAQTCFDVALNPIQCSLDYNPRARWTVPNNSVASPTPTKAPPFADPLQCTAPVGSQAHVGEDYCPRPIPCSQSGTPSGCVPASPSTDGSPNNSKLTQITGNGETYLLPGTYYGGIKIASSSGTIRFSPGIYVLAGSDHNNNAGGFTYTSGNICGLRTVADPPDACPVATGVTIFNTGNPYAGNASDRLCASMNITGSGLLRIAAPTVRRTDSGISPVTLAGYKNMLFWQDDTCSQQFRFAGSSSGSTWTATGLMYLPQANMQITGGGNFGSVQIITKTFSQGGSQSININFSRYINTDTQEWKLIE